MVENDKASFADKKTIFSLKAVLASLKHFFFYSIYNVQTDMKIQIGFVYVDTVQFRPLICTKNMSIILVHHMSNTFYEFLTVHSK